MQYLNGSYTSYFNRRHRRAGHLFQGRFKGHLVEEEGHFLEVSRYIHLNPVRAKMAARPEAYRWSSYPAYAYNRRCPGWLKTDLLLSQLGPDNTGHNAYREKVQQYAEEKKSIWEEMLARA